MATKLELENENKELKTQLSGLEEKINMLMQMMAKQEEANKVEQPAKREIEQSYEDDSDEMIDIPNNKMVKVTNLFDGTLNLKGLNDVVFTFGEFGQSMAISYEHLIRIYNKCPKWAKEGLFYIHDKNVVKMLGLSYDYKKLLTKEEILNIINMEESEIRHKLLNTSNEQRETIKYLFIRSLAEGDMKYLKNRANVELISDLLKVNIREFAYKLEEMTSKRR